MRPSPFFHTPDTADVNSLAILHLKRDSLLPVKLLSIADDGYAEGAVTNTRFGSFPHSTLVGLRWGSQVRASKVDTGSRGRKAKRAQQEQDQQTTPEVAAENETSKKRKSDAETQESPGSPLKKRKPDNGAVNGAQHRQQVGKAAVEAGTGFIHILPPTPESWTSSLDHRTQVVYTPDYSYILQRLRVKPGSRLIEAGAGSGSFTHAAVRAIFNGDQHVASSSSTQTGKVYSFEYHEPRVQTLSHEITDHGLDGFVELVHRDVCNDGFLLPDNTPPSANAVFLDLPAPWQAFKHLTRSSPTSPLDPSTAIHLCTFSPCIEQVMATVSALRKAGWADIAMIEVQNRRIDVRRERVGLREEGLRGVNASAASVDEAIGRLREVETKLSSFHANKSAANTNGPNRTQIHVDNKRGSKAERLDRIRKEAEDRKIYKEGKLVSRTEPEVKTHTSYLVFAVLPRDWSEADEKACDALYPVDEIMKGPTR